MFRLYDGFNSFVPMTAEEQTERVMDRFLDIIEDQDHTGNALLEDMPGEHMDSVVRSLESDSRSRWVMR